MPPRKLPEDEFMAAAIGDLNWLKQCMKDNKREKMDGIHFDKNGLSALHLASIHGRLECIQFLLESQKIDINLGSKNGWRSIHLCISNQTGKRAFQSLTYLLKKGADPSLTNEDGVTPLHQAASEGHFECLKLLLEIGAKPDSKDCRGNLPIDLAKLWGHRKCAKMLANRMWHQEKENVAQEMRQLKKDRMREVLDDLDRAEEIAEQQKFFGQEAFKDWLAKHAEDKKTEQRENTKQKAALSAAKTRIKGKARPTEKNSLMTANSKKESQSAPSSTPKKPDMPPATTDNKPVDSVGEKIRPLGTVVEASREFLTSEKHGGNSNLFNKEELAKMAAYTEEAGPADETNAQIDDKRHIPGVTPIEWSPLNHSCGWNTSTHVTATFHDYQPGLRDVYPRDIYTLEPHPLATPVELNPYTRDPVGVLMGETDEKLVQEAGSLRLIEEEEEEEDEKPRKKKSDKKSQYGPFRGMVYRCQTILDVPVRSKPRDVHPPISEVPLHISSDVTSLLVKSALGQPIAATSSKPVSAVSRARTAGSSSRGARVGQGLVVVDEEMRARIGISEPGSSLPSTPVATK